MTFLQLIKKNIAPSQKGNGGGHAGSAIDILAEFREQWVSISKHNIIQISMRIISGSKSWLIS